MSKGFYSYNMWNPRRMRYTRSSFPYSTRGTKEFKTRLYLLFIIKIMAKTLHYADDARKGLFAGIEAVANAVKVTMGPKGRNVILERTY